MPGAENPQWESNMSDTMDTGDAAADQGDDTVDTDQVQDTEDNQPSEGAEELGDKGKKALDAMKEQRRKARAEAATLRKELDELKRQLSDKDKTPDEQALAEARREAAAEASAKANERILRSEVRAAAAGKLNDPADALKLLDLDQFEVGGDGDVDTEEITDAINDLLQSKPYLAAQRGTTQFDSARGKRKPAGQLTQDDVKRMSPEEIQAARKAGRLDDLLGKKR